VLVYQFDMKQYRPLKRKENNYQENEQVQYRRIEMYVRRNHLPVAASIGSSSSLIAAE
jgi:hypothetical protein